MPPTTELRRAEHASKSLLLLVRLQRSTHCSNSNNWSTSPVHDDCTPQWYVRSDGNCVMSCEEDIGGSCGGLASSSDLLFGRKSDAQVVVDPVYLPLQAHPTYRAIRAQILRAIQVESRAQIHLVDQALTQVPIHYLINSAAALH